MSKTVSIEVGDECLAELEPFLKAQGVTIEQYILELLGDAQNSQEKVQGDIRALGREFENYTTTVHLEHALYHIETSKLKVAMDLANSEKQPFGTLVRNLLLDWKRESHAVPSITGTTKSLEKMEVLIGKRDLWQIRKKVGQGGFSSLVNALIDKYIAAHG